MVDGVAVAAGLADTTVGKVASTVGLADTTIGKVVVVARGMVVVSGKIGATEE